jgi:ubiquinone/menaquinone biosynthesis C-methylase UbiE
MRYFSLGRRVPETLAVEPQALVRLYGLITAVPLVRTAYRRFVEGALHQGVSQGTVLDLGTGPGYVAQELARRRPGLRVLGLDLAVHMVEQASHRAWQVGLQGRSLWPQADAHRLPVADESVDLAISSFALHHWRNPLGVLNEVARVLKPGGGYYLADLCREVDVVQRLFAYASIPAISLPFGSYGGYGGYYESVRAGYTRAELLALLEQSELAGAQVEMESTWFLPVVAVFRGN